MPVVAAIQEAEAGGSLEPGRWRMQRTEITPLHSSLGNRMRLSQKTNKKTDWVQWLTAVNQHFWDAEVGKLLEVRSSRPAWPTW